MEGKNMLNSQEISVHDNDQLPQERNNDTNQNSNSFIYKFKWLFIYLSTIPIGLFLSVISYYVVFYIYEIFIPYDSNNYQNESAYYTSLFLSIILFPVYVLSSSIIFYIIKNKTRAKKYKVIFVISVILGKLKWPVAYLLTIPIGIILSTILFFAIMVFLSTDNPEDGFGSYLIAFPIFWTSLPVFILFGFAFISKLRNGIVAKKIKVLIALTVILAILLQIAFWAYIFFGLGR